MYRMLSSRRPWLIAGIAAALLLGVGGGVALAASPYRVHVKVKPKAMSLDSFFKIAFKGFSASKSDLVVILNRRDSCSASPTTDVGSRVFRKRVKGHYSGSVWHYAKFDGRHHACVYLTNASAVTRAHAGTFYKVG